MSNTVVGWNNLILSSALVASSAEITLPALNLQNDIGSASTAWQTLYAVTTATLTVTPTSGGQTWRAFGLFQTNLTPGAAVTFTLKNGATVVWTVTVAGPPAGYGQVVAVAPSDQTADYLLVSIVDTANADGHLNVPLAFAGPAWVPAIGAAWQTTFGRDFLTKSVVTEGGQEYPIPRWQRRRWDIAMDSIGQTEIWASAQELDRVSRSGGNVLFVPDSASATIGNEAVFGICESLADVAFMAGFAQRYAWKFRVKERK